ncbi:ATP synthase mitochondrial F1 complex assembly factor 2-like [Hylaeus volcanicus]|uniref:ATP synthase mitochondrial F1 complex assembly factor 2-like n=1 Tax=Hylaeus volcanicus TaxID=313075 RepID=UPI0023B83076|nr:ATP synthase mitochondrial F1 complex assembly factor 2-like [Hylaeus volcanicus]
MLKHSLNYFAHAANSFQIVFKAQSHTSSKELKRFYKQVTINKINQCNNWGIFLDGKPLKTPGGKVLAVTSSEGSKLIADEWNKQHDIVNCREMPYTSLAIQALDLIESHSNLVEKKILEYLRTDCFLIRPKNFQESQNFINKDYLGSLEPLHCKIQKFYNLSEPLKMSTNLEIPAQNVQDLDKLAYQIRKRNHLQLSCLFTATQILHSYLLSLAMLDSLESVDKILYASMIENKMQQQVWGSTATQKKEEKDIKQRLVATHMFHTQVA